MNFSIFRDFFSDFSEFILIFNNKNELKKEAKSGLIPRGSHVDATWHSGPRGSATRAHVAPTRRIHIFIIYIVYIMGIQPSVFQKGIQTLYSSGLINPTISSILFRVGLIHTMC